MRVEDLHDDAGVLTGFRIAAGLFGRRRACRIAAAVPGARVLRAPRLFRGGPEEFCAFDVDGVTFLIIEPFGDSDQYWVVAEEPSAAAVPLIERVRMTFQAAA